MHMLGNYHVCVAISTLRGRIALNPLGASCFDLPDPQAALGLVLGAGHDGGPRHEPELRRALRNAVDFRANRSVKRISGQVRRSPGSCNYAAYGRLCDVADKPTPLPGGETRRSAGKRRIAWPPILGEFRHNQPTEPIGKCGRSMAGSDLLTDGEDGSSSVTQAGHKQTVERGVPRQLKAAIQVSIVQVVAAVLTSAIARRTLFFDGRVPI